MKHIFELAEGKRFVGGLHWQALGGLPTELKREAQELAKQLSFDLIVWRHSSAEQVGFASTNEGYEPGMLSAAAIVSKTLEVDEDQRDFICATELPDGRFLYVAQADGVIIPEGDFIGNETEVRGKMLEDMATGRRWNYIVAPIQWGISDSIERTFEDFLPRKNGKIDFKHKWWALREVKTNYVALIKKNLIHVVAVLGVIGGLYGYKMYNEMKEAELQAIIAAQMAEQQAAQAVVIPPWTQKPRAVDSTKVCITAFDKLENLWPGDWEPQNVICDPANAFSVINWKRGKHGWRRHLESVVPNAVVDAKSEMANLNVQFDPLQVTEASKESLVSEGDRQKHMNIVAQEVGLTLEFTPPPPVVLLPGQQPAATPPPQWREVRWSVKGMPISPSSVIEKLDGPGLRVDVVRTNFNNGTITWDLEGVQYVLP
ncbi:type 4b pilus protein PilO2 [Azonexus hydrophilus]|uniref:Type 4b pilus protein PilO2 n=1 Tax=Azonexus hydrophilus TaxID=418702 RepID=A0ABZ2XLM4_9RHOO